MKIKAFLVLMVITFSVTVASAQMVEKDSKFLNLGVGFGTAIYSGSLYNLQVPPVSVSFEYVIKDNLFDDKSSLGVGGYLGYLAYKYNYQDYGWKYSSIVIGPRGYLHYSFIDKLDTYTGILLGYNILSSKYFGPYYAGVSAASGGLTASWFLGGRYFFNDNIAGMLELGYGVSYLNIGVCFKL